MQVHHIEGQLVADIVAKRFSTGCDEILIQVARLLDSIVAPLIGAADFCNKICQKRT